MQTSGCIRIPYANVRMSDLARFDIPSYNSARVLKYMRFANAVHSVLGAVHIERNSTDNFVKWRLQEKEQTWK